MNWVVFHVWSTWDCNDLWPWLYKCHLKSNIEHTKQSSTFNSHYIFTILNLRVCYFYSLCSLALPWPSARINPSMFSFRNSKHLHPHSAVFLIWPKATIMSWSRGKLSSGFLLLLTTIEEETRSSLLRPHVNLWSSKRKIRSKALV